MTTPQLGFLWPKTVPILSASDIVKWNQLRYGYNKDGSKHSLFGWAIRTFGLQERIEFFKCFRIAMLEVMRDTELEGILHFNDVDEMLEKKACAALWNRAAYLLGYTEGNPQSRKVVL